MSVDAVTRRWIRNAADERAAANGCTFDEARGEHVLNFARKYLRLYEGDKAGQVLEPMGWQVEVTMRLFGWVRYSERWGRLVRRFRSASIWIPKKNGKSPTLAWWALYLLCADGEMGQKVYLGAVDGQQARDIAGRHVIEMVTQSPDLMAECTINKSLLQVTHEPTRSILKPISSSDAKVQKAKEGLNGCVLIDETHVVNRDFMGRVSRAGISRSEPLTPLEVSTAGDDPDGYGKERYDYGRSVNENGGNEQLLFVDYSAPQDVSDEKLAADPEKFGQLANPAWNETIDPAEFRADYEASKVSLPEFARFKMYRLNIWQKATNPWLRAGDWDKCRREYTAEDLRGLACWAGLDLSKTRDLSALVFVFKWLTGYRLWPLFFMPEETARERNNKKPFLQWARDGLITLTPGSTVDYGFVSKAFKDACDRFDVRALFYDPWQAEKTTQELEQGLSIDGKVIVEGTGVPRTEFRQTIGNYAQPTEEFEKAILDGRLEHPGHPVLDWQAGHVMVYCDANRNKRPIKPKPHDWKSIDGMVAGIMGLAAAMQAPDTNSMITII